MYLIFALILLTFALWPEETLSVVETDKTGFWYGRTDLPDFNYTNFETIPYVNLTMKINRPFQDGPGQNLTTDPIDPTRPLYVGNTINRQTFEAQFVMEIEETLRVSRNRIYVMNIRPGDVHFSWETTNVIVNFVITECNITCTGPYNITLIEAVQDLTEQVQDMSSRLYTAGTFVTSFTDPDYGVNVVNWGGPGAEGDYAPAGDFSLKLTYAINNIGDSISISNEGDTNAFITHGGLRTCDKNDAWIHSYYCEFERFFEDDIANALSIVPYRVQIFFVKYAGLDSVLTHFRILPARPGSSERTVLECLEELHVQVRAPYNSSLYAGNVTIRTDPTWGVSGKLGIQRREAALFTLKYYDYSESRLADDDIMDVFGTPYDRCKANRRCNWGQQSLNQETNKIAYSHRLFDRGERVPVVLFLDFEDWRLGTRGWNWDGVYAPVDDGSRPFSFTSMPTSMPTAPSGQPTSEPTNGMPTSAPTGEPTGEPTGAPTSQPSGLPTSQPTGTPTSRPTGAPSGEPSGEPTGEPTGQPTGMPTDEPTEVPTSQPTPAPTISSPPSGKPTGEPTTASIPTGEPTGEPTGQPTSVPSTGVTPDPTMMPTSAAANVDTVEPMKAIKGAHFWPFHQRSLGPTWPAFHEEENQGLVLDRRNLYRQIKRQETLINDIQGRVKWTRDNDEFSTMGYELRSRKDVKRNMTWVAQDYEDWEMNERAELQELSLSQCSQRNCTIMFNTSSLELIGAINDMGVLRHTGNGTEVAVYTFNSIYLGPEVEVILVGQRALSLVSKTQLIINTTFYAHPGTIGGFQGGFNTARLYDDSLSDTPRDIRICDIGNYCSIEDRNLTHRNFTRDERAAIRTNNVNGPGSGNLRVLPFVVTSSAADVNEVQRIVTTAQQGQTLGGGFKLHFGDYTTPLIAHDCSAALLERIIEENLNVMSPQSTMDKTRPRNSNRFVDGRAGVGQVTVTRIATDDQEGSTWIIEFESAIGNIEQLRITNYLTGLKASIEIDTLQDGNEILGSFTLNLFGADTQPISARETAYGLQQKLLDMPQVRTAWVKRIDPSENCDDGLCSNGPLQSRGYIWSIYVTSTVDNNTPLFPNSEYADVEFEWQMPTANTDLLVGTNATVTVEFNGHASTDDKMRELLVDRPFSLAYGGAGASYGGSGGRGYSDNPTGPQYGDQEITDLLGGSGGCMRGPHPMELNIGPISRAYGRGGHGGGAIEFVAANDIIVGHYGKVIMNGGDGEQTSEGGGGGGSGGAIVLAAGGVVENYGVLDVHGGAGGYGGVGKRGQYSASQIDQFDTDSWESKTLDDMAGGGGGGGRIAIYAQSIVSGSTAVENVEGGKCGVKKMMKNNPMVVLNATLRIDAHGIPLDPHRLLHLGAVYLNETLVTQRVFDNGPPTYIMGGYMGGGILEGYYKVWMFEKDTPSSEDMERAFVESSDRLLGRVEIKARNVTLIANSTGVQYIIDEEQTSCPNPGNHGSLYKESKMTTLMHVRPTTYDGAEGTKNGLFLSNRERTTTITGSSREAPFSWNGPTFRFEPGQPTRVTYYTKLVSVDGESSKSNFGSLFSLLQGTRVTSVIGVFVGDQIKFGNNYGSAVDERDYLKRFKIIDEYPTFDRWYKVDIHIRWGDGDGANYYYILLDDILVTPDVEFFDTDYIDGVRLSLTRAVDVWFDEIYVGFDNTMDFKCPDVTRQSVNTQSPVQRGWVPEEVNEKGSDGNTQYFSMTRHYNFMDDTGTVKFDGQGEVSVFADLKNKFKDGDYPAEKGKFYAGALVYLTNSPRSGKQPSGRSSTVVNQVETSEGVKNKGLWYKAPDGKGGAGDGRHYWYTDHLFQDDANPSLSGGIAACSSGDFLSWRFEGIVYHFTNTSDMVLGREGPFTMERPKLLFNHRFNQYVLYAAFDRSDETNRNLKMSAIATSPYEDGPFLFRRSFYPDGNETRDQVTYIQDSKAQLGRTYYATVEFVLPKAMMQPVWESVKNRYGEINFTTNYHRAFYDIGYDNFHDIYEQRWRNEDQPYNVSCIDKLTGASRSINPGEQCKTPSEKKQILGQGFPPITTKFVAPDNPDNAWWVATSVPAVRAQPWSSNYRDGYCGVRRLDSDMEMTDPDLDFFTPQPRDACGESISNIADNPIHATVPDKLIGEEEIRLKRRTKFMAISQLTEDYMDTTGFLKSFEGELSTGYLVSMDSEQGQFGLGSGEKLATTFAAPVQSDEYKTAVDYKVRFKQFIDNNNDRASYSLACVIDGVCPVNYKDQITDGHT